MLTGALHPLPEAVDPGWRETALAVIDGLVESGHVSARFRYEEVERLHDMLRQVASPDQAHASGEEVAQYPDEYGAGAVEGLSAADMLSVAELMGRYPIEELGVEPLGGDWLWEQNFAGWQGMSLNEEHGQTSPTE